MGSNANDMTYSAQTLATSEFYAFGMLSKSYESGYRFGFNGQEKDDEVYGNGNSYTAEFWQYDPRLGRRWNKEPIIDSFPFFSSFLVFANNPISFKDENGKIITTVNSEATQLIDATFDYFGGEVFKRIIGFKDKKPKGESGYSYFASNNFKNEKEFLKELSKNLKKTNVELSQEQLHQAYVFYQALKSNKNVEVSVLTKESGSQPRFGEGNHETQTEIIESSKAPSKNKTYNNFLYYFRENSQYLDQLTGDKKYGLIPFEPMSREGDPGHQGTIVIDRTGQSKRNTVPVLIEALEKVNF